MTPSLNFENSRLQKAVAWMLLAAYLPMLAPAALAEQIVSDVITGENASVVTNQGVPPPTVPPLAPAYVMPAPVHTGHAGAPNRMMPAGVVKSSDAITLPAAPTDAQITAFKLFPEVLVAASGRMDSAENTALGSALRAYHEVGNGEDISIFNGYLAAYPEGRWSASLRLNLGLRLFKACRFTPCFKLWRAAWDASKSHEAGPMKAVADRSMAELLRLNARIGRVDALESLFEECKGRTFTGVSSELVSGARFGLWRMKNTPGMCFRCGSLALDRIYAFNKGVPTAHVPELLNADSPSTGFPLTTVRDMAAKAGLRYRMAFRSPGAELVSPAVINWKVGHYAALLKVAGGVAMLQDPTFPEFSLAATGATIDEEASGYFLIPEGPLPAGWRAVDDAEGAKVFGKGDTQGPSPDNTGPDDPKTPSPDCNKGMAGYAATLMVCSLNITDTPLWYAPAFGPSVAFTLTYNQREASQPSVFDYGNVGPKWLNNWVSYIDEQRTGDGSSRVFTSVMRQKGGGGRSFPPISSSSDELGQASFGLQYRSQALLIKRSESTYAYCSQDGSVAVYGLRTGLAGAHRYFLTEESDVFGNKVTYSYDAQSRLIAVTDAAGLVTTLAYENSSNSLLLTKVTDPFGRSATMEYNAAGLLSKITDMMGISSAFTYRTGSDFITALTTPYGTSTFDTGEVGDVRWLAMTDPTGGTEFLEYRNRTSGIVPGFDASASEPLAPTGMNLFNSYLDRRNTCYWGKKAYAKAGMDYHSLARNYDLAVIYHWLHGGVNASMTSPLLESVRYPGQNRIWYNYEGQTWGAGEGPSSNISLVGRVLPDGSTQLTSTSYGPKGRPVQTVDPLGRTTRIRYAANGCEVAGTDVKKADGTWETLSSYTYPAPPAAAQALWSAGFVGTWELGVDLQALSGPPPAGFSYGGTDATWIDWSKIPPAPSYRPATVTDASGLVTLFTYNGRGQPVTITAPDGHVTTFTYDEASGGASFGRVTGVTTSVSGGSTRTATTTYDGFGRPRTVTDAEGYAVSYDYDAFGRVTLVTYPDSSTVQNTYDKLDLSATKDRAGRITRNSYNALRRLATSTDPLGRTTAYNWCRCGALQDMFDSMGRVTHWDYDTQGHLILRKMADGSQYNYAYDTAGRLSTATDPMGQVTTTSYNKDDSVASVAYSNLAQGTAATAPVSYTYDPVYGRVTKMTDGIGDTVFTYNAAGAPGAFQVASVDGPLLGDIDKWVYSYDQYGRSSSRTLGGESVPEATAYDTDGRVASLTNALGTFNFSYDGTSARPSGVSRDGGLTTTFGYSPVIDGKRLLSIVHALAQNAVSRHDYEYAADYSLARWNTVNSALTQDRHVVHDPVGRLIKSETLNSSGAVTSRENFSYDRGDNLISIGRNDSITGLVPNSLNQVTQLSGAGRLRVEGRTDEPAKVSVNGVTAATDSTNKWSAEVPVQSGGNTLTVRAEDFSPNKNVSQKSWSVNLPPVTPRSFTYDANGNLLNDGNRTYTWDAVNHLVSVTASGSTYTFGYDGTGHRVSESVNGTLARRWVWAPGAAEPSAEFNAAGDAVTKRFFGQGEVRTGSSGSAAFFYTRDHLGSIREVLDGSNAIVARYDYDSYGRRTVLGTDSFGADFGYTGHLTHAPTGLVFTLYRVYDAETGRWLSHDPIWEMGGMNVYGYVGGGPLMMTDPMGLRGWWNYLLDADVYNGAGYRAMQGGAAWADGFNPFGNPFANAGAYNPCDGDMKFARGAGSVSFNAALIAATAGLGGAASAGAEGVEASEITSGASSSWNTGIPQTGRYLNIGTDVAAGEFQGTLQSNGFNIVKQGISGNGMGSVTVLSNGETTYSIYTATSTGEASAQVFNHLGQTVAKYRLGMP